MKIEHESVVEINYVLTRLDDGEQLDATEEPMVYLQGHGNIMYALEMELEGKSAGDHIDVDLPAVQAYGVRREDFVERIPTKHLSAVKKERIKKGSVVRFRLNGKVSEGTVVKMGKFNADVDMNHPLAGADVRFAVDVLSVRTATSEEIAHGHAHGRGGHQH